MLPKKTELSESLESILEAMNKATRKLVEETALKGGSLVISVDGEVKHVPAKDLLAELDEKAKTKDAL